MDFRYFLFADSYAHQTKKRLIKRAGLPIDIEITIYESPRQEPAPNT